MESNNHEHHNDHGHASEQGKKGFFEKYQTFFSIIIAGLLIGAGILLGRIASNPSSATAVNTNADDSQMTQDQVRAVMLADGKDAGVNAKKLAQCLDNGTETNLIASDVALAQTSGVQGTPTFFILKRTYNPDGSVATEKQFPIIGAVDQTTFMNAVTAGQAPTGQPSLPASAQKIVLSTNDHYMGPKNAAVTIVEYSDIDCPFCRREKPVIDSILKQHPEYAFVYRESPIVQLHPWAGYKAEAAECANDQGGSVAFFKFLDKAVIPLTQ